MERPDSRTGHPGSVIGGGGGGYYPPSNASASPTPSEQQFRQRHPSDMDTVSSYRLHQQQPQHLQPQHQRGGPDSISFLRQQQLASASASATAEENEKSFSQLHLSHHNQQQQQQQHPSHALAARGGAAPPAEPLYSPPLNGVANGRAPSRDLYR